MDVISVARQLGRAIQEDPRYIRMEIARTANDNDENLQNLIGEFNLKRISINQLSVEENADQEKISKLNEEIMALYNQIMGTEAMQEYNIAKTEFDAMMNYVETIISASTAGEDPDTVEEHTGGCSGSCSTCGGCH